MKLKKFFASLAGIKQPKYVDLRHFISFVGMKKDSRFQSHHVMMNIKDIDYEYLCKCFNFKKPYQNKKNGKYYMDYGLYPQSEYDSFKAENGKLTPTDRKFFIYDSVSGHPVNCPEFKTQDGDFIVRVRNGVPGKWNKKRKYIYYKVEPIKWEIKNYASTQIKKDPESYNLWHLESKEFVDEDTISKFVENAFVVNAEHMLQMGVERLGDLIYYFNPDEKNL